MSSPRGRDHSFRRRSQDGGGLRRPFRIFILQKTVRRHQPRQDHLGTSVQEAATPIAEGFDRALDDHLLDPPALPYDFASHFAPEMLLEALALYRREFTPSDRLAKPHAMAAINVFAADTDEEGRRLSTSMQQSFARLSTGKPGKLPPPVDDIEAVLTAQQIAGAKSRLVHSAVGGPETVRKQIADFIALTQVDELMITGMMHDNAARIRSLEIVAEARTALAEHAAISPS